MQLQQLRYLIAAAKEGSFRAAAQSLYVSQTSVSNAVRELEVSSGVRIFERTSRGIELTADGVELVGYAKRVVEQADVMEARYARDHSRKADYTISSLHSLIVAHAFGDFISLHAGESCSFELHENNMNQVVDDMKGRRADLGLVYLSNFNETVTRDVLRKADLKFVPLFTARPHVVTGTGHPLASLGTVRPEQLAPYDRYELVQGLESSSLFASEPLSKVPHRRRIVLDDNSTLAAVLHEHDGYALALDVSPANRSLALVELDTEEVLTVGYVRRYDTPQGKLDREFIALLSRRVVEQEPDITPDAATYGLAHMRHPES